MAELQPEILTMEDQVIRDLVERYLRKSIVRTDSERGPRMATEDDDIPIAAVVDWEERQFRVLLPTGLRVTYAPAEPGTIFTPLDKLFIQACVDFLGPSLFLFESADDDLRGLMQLASSHDHLLFPDDHVLERYIGAATGRRRDLQVISNRIAIRDFLRLVREVIQSRIEASEIYSGVALFPNLSALKQACSGLSLFSTPHPMSDFKSLKPFLPVADGEHTFILVSDNLIYGLGRIPDMYYVRDCRRHYRSDIPGDPIIAQFKGIGACDIRAPHEGRSTTVLTYINGLPLIRDDEAVFDTLREQIEAFFPEVDPLRIKRLAGLLLQLSPMNKGAIVLLGQHFPDLIRVFSCETSDLEKCVFQPGDEDAVLQEFLLRHTFTDGAVLFDNTLTLRGLGAILPVDSFSAGPDHGARHTAARSYTSHHRHVLGIVVSQDGPISVYQGGRRLLVI